MDGQVSPSDGEVLATELLSAHPSSDGAAGSDPGPGLAKCDHK